MAPGDLPKPFARRLFLRAALLVGGSAALLGGAVFARRGIDQQRLTASGKQVLRGVARGVFSDLLPKDSTARAEALDRHVAAAEALLVQLPPALRFDCSMLLGTLGTVTGRVALTGMASSWEAASVEELHAAFDKLRLSPLRLPRVVYKRLRDVNCMAFFADPANGELIGYHGAVL